LSVVSIVYDVVIVVSSFCNCVWLVIQKADVYGFCAHCLYRAESVAYAVIIPFVHPPHSWSVRKAKDFVKLCQSSQASNLCPISTGSAFGPLMGQVAWKC